MALAIGLYLTVLLLAAQITAPSDVAVQPGTVTAIGGAPQAAQTAESRSLADATESPVVTLMIAGATIAAAGGYRLARAVRRPRAAPVPVRGRRVSIST